MKKLAFWKTPALLLFVTILFLFFISHSFAGMLEPLDVRNVNVGGEIGRRIEATVENNILKMDVDKDFLKPFQERSKTGGYIGLGKTIDALVRFAAYTNDPRVIALKEHTVREIIATQEKDGYISMFRKKARLSELWDIHEMTYIVYGLTMDYVFFGEKESLAAAKKGADYIVDGWSADPDMKPGHGSITVHMAVTGLEETLLALYDVTGNTKYLDFCVNNRKLITWDAPIVIGRHGDIGGHVYAYLTRSLAQLRLNRIQPDERLWGSTQAALDFMLQQDGLSITGTCGQHECWHDTQEGLANLGETCATAYLVRWLDEILQQRNDPFYGDLMERTIYNALFASQSPDGRKIRYYSPLEGDRIYYPGDTYCCPCNYRRIIPELPSMIVYRSEAGLAVNLYTDSTLKTTVADKVPVTITQKTDYPSNGKVKIKVDPEHAASFALKLRIPRWCSTATIAVNGKPISDTIQAGTFHAIQREWKPGDEVELKLPMELRVVKGRKVQAGRVAIMYGPTVFCLNPNANPGLTETNPRMLTLDLTTLSGPMPDDSVRPGGLKCTVKAWKTTKFYPMAKTDFELTLTEFADPNGKATYFHVPNPYNPVLISDEFLEKAEK